MPEDFFTALQWANKLELSLSHTRRLLLEGTKAGKIERREFRAAFGKIVRKEPHYRLIASRSGSQSPGRRPSPSAAGR